MTTPTELPACIAGWEAITAENAAVTADAQIVNGQWYRPRFGCDSLQMAVESPAPAAVERSCDGCKWLPRTALLAPCEYCSRFDKYEDHYTPAAKVANPTN